MVRNVINLTLRHVGALLIGALLVPLAIVTFPWLDAAGDALYDRMRPVVTEWAVLSSEMEGDDLVISGTMRKQRDCLFVPPTLARDVATGRNYAVTSESPTAGKTWAASDIPQAWGPWRVEGVAGKTLMFINIYACGHSAPVAAELGTHVAESWTK